MIVWTALAFLVMGVGIPGALFIAAVLGLGRLLSGSEPVEQHPYIEPEDMVVHPGEPW